METLKAADAGIVSKKIKLFEELGRSDCICGVKWTRRYFGLGLFFRLKKISS